MPGGDERCVWCRRVGLLERVELAPAFRARVNSAHRVIEVLDFEIEVFTNLASGRLRGHSGYVAIQAISGVGPILAAVFVAEIGEVSRAAARELIEFIFYGLPDGHIRCLTHRSA